MKSITKLTIGLITITLISGGKCMLANPPQQDLINYATNISEVRTLTGHGEWVDSVAISPEGQTICSGGSDSTIKVWDLVTGNLKATLTDHRSSVLSVYQETA